MAPLIVVLVLISSSVTRLHNQVYTALTDLLCQCIRHCFVLGDSVKPGDGGAYPCRDPCELELQSEHLFILHKFLNCPHWADTNLRNLLAGVTMEEFLGYMKVDLHQRMMDHMLETSELMNDNNSIISISSDSDDEETGSVIDLTESQKEETPLQDLGNQVQTKDICKSTMRVDNKQQDNNVLKKINDTQSTSDTDIFCSEFNSVFDKNIETDTGSASGVTGTETLTLETGAEKPVVTSSPSKTPSLEQVLSVDITTTVNEMGAKISTSDNRVSKAMSKASEVVTSSPSKTPSPKKVLAITKDITITVNEMPANMSASENPGFKGQV